MKIEAIPFHSSEDEGKLLDVQRTFVSQAKSHSSEKIRKVQERTEDSFFSTELRNLNYNIEEFARNKKKYAQNEEKEKKEFESTRIKYSQNYQEKEKQKREKEEKRKNRRAKGGCLFWVIAIVLGFAALGKYVVYPKMIYPRLEAESYYTPEIIKTYSGSYSAAEDMKGIITFTSCDEDGNLQGIFEFVYEDSIYGKYEISGKITDKRNNNNIMLTIRPGKWIIQPEDFITLEEMSAEITNNYNTFKCSDYRMNWTEGENGEYLIKTPSDLDKLRNSSSVYYLKNDIDLSGIEWKPIDGFTGTLIGNGYTIKNMKIALNENNVGFFSTLNGVVNNLHFEEAKINVSGKRENIGILCGKLESGSIANISTSGIITATSSQNVGGVVGYVEMHGSCNLGIFKNDATVLGSANVGGIIGNFENIADNYNNYTVILNQFENTGTVKTLGECAGGCIGYLYANNETGYSILVQASEFKNEGNINGQSYVGGIVGYAYSDTNESYIKECSSHGNISADYRVGGIAGKVRNMLLLSCENAGGSVVANACLTEDGENYAYVGGIVGEGFFVGDSTNMVSIAYEGTGKYVGGIAGYITIGTSFTMSNLTNNADISGADCVGGIFGGFEVIVDSYDNYTGTIQNLKNDGSIVASNDYVGGIVGYLYAKNNAGSYGMALQMSDFSSKGIVQGNAYVGGIFGYAYSDITTSAAQYLNVASEISAEYMVGGVAGKIENISMLNCSNVGTTITASGYWSNEGENYAYVGGYAGYGYMASDCENMVELTYSAGGKYVAGVIGYATGPANSNSIKNLSNKAKVLGDDYVGGVIGYCGITGEYSVENLKNVAEISGNEYVGGVIGCVYDAMDSYSNHKVTMSKCENSGVVDGRFNVGGLIGYFEVCNSGSYSIATYISGMKNTGNVRGEAWIGGVFGYAYSDSNDSTITNCLSSGMIAADYMVGGIAGEVDNISMAFCDNAGTSIAAAGYTTEGGTKYAYVGGYVGKGYLVSDCTNTVDITYEGGGRYVGGIMGYSDASGSYEMSNLKNAANISGKEYVGGIIGGLENYVDSYSNCSVSLKKFENSGTIKTTGSYAGGTIAYFTAENKGNSYSVKVFISDFVNTGKVSGKTYIGGVLGYAESDSTESKMTGTVATGSVSGKTPYGKVKGKVENITVVTD